MTLKLIREQLDQLDAAQKKIAELLASVYGTPSQSDKPAYEPTLKLIGEQLDQLDAEQKATIEFLQKSKAQYARITGSCADCYGTCYMSCRGLCITSCKVSTNIW
jgi:hypothetical protein